MHAIFVLCIKSFSRKTNFQRALLMNAETATNFVEVLFANHPCCVSSHHRKCKKCIYRNGKNFRNGDKNFVIKLSNFRTNFLVTFRVSYRCREEERLAKAPIGNVGVREIDSTTAACNHRADVLVQVVTWVGFEIYLKYNLK